MSPASFTTARLMETWAHGQDVVDALGQARPATARLRSVAEIGYRVRQAARTRMSRGAAHRAAPAPLPRARSFDVHGAPALGPVQIEALLALWRARSSVSEYV